MENFTVTDCFNNNHSVDHDYYSPVFIDVNDKYMAERRCIIHYSDIDLDIGKYGRRKLYDCWISYHF